MDTAIAVYKDGRHFGTLRLTEAQESPKEKPTEPLDVRACLTHGGCGCACATQDREASRDYAH